MKAARRRKTALCNALALCIDDEGRPILVDLDALIGELCNQQYTQGFQFGYQLGASGLLNGATDNDTSKGVVTAVDATQAAAEARIAELEAVAADLEGEIDNLADERRRLRTALIGIGSLVHHALGDGGALDE